MSTITEITPYIGIAMPFAAAWFLLDVILKDSIKVGFARWLRKLTETFKNPFSFKFYLVSVISSILLTGVILLFAGFIKSVADQDISFSIAVKSAAALLVGVFIKILLLDWLLAIKTVVFLSLFIALIRKSVRKRLAKSLLVLFVIFDIFSSMLFVNSALGDASEWQVRQIEKADLAALEEKLEELKQKKIRIEELLRKAKELQEELKSLQKLSAEISGDLTALKSDLDEIEQDPSSKSFWVKLKDLIDEFSVSVSILYQNAFCIFNGCTLIYLYLGVRFFWRRIRSVFNHNRVEEKIFSITGTVLVAIYAILLIIYVNT